MKTINIILTFAFLSITYAPLGYGETISGPNEKTVPLEINTKDKVKPLEPISTNIIKTEYNQKKEHTLAISAKKNTPQTSVQIKSTLITLKDINDKDLESFTFSMKNIKFSENCLAGKILTGDPCLLTIAITEDIDNNFYKYEATIEYDSGDEEEIYTDPITGYFAEITTIFDPNNNQLEIKNISKKSITLNDLNPLSEYLEKITHNTNDEKLSGFVLAPNQSAFFEIKRAERNCDKTECKEQLILKYTIENITKEISLEFVINNDEIKLQASSHKTTASSFMSMSNIIKYGTVALTGLTLYLQNNKIRKLQGNYKNLDAEKTKLQENNRKIIEGLDKEFNEIKQTDKQPDDRYANKLKELNDKIEAKNKEIEDIRDTYSEELQSKSKHIESLQERFAERKLEIRRLKKELTQKEQETKNFKEQTESAIKKADEFNKKVITEKTKEIVEYNNKLKKLQDNIGKLGNEYNEERRKLHKQLKKLNKEKTDLERKFKGQQDSLKTEKDKLEKQLKVKQNDHAKTQKNLKDLQRKAKEQQNKINNQEILIHSMRERSKDALRNLDDKNTLVSPPRPRPTPQSQLTKTGGNKVKRSNSTTSSNTDFIDGAETTDDNLNNNSLLNNDEAPNQNNSTIFPEFIDGADNDNPSQSNDDDDGTSQSDDDDDDEQDDRKRIFKRNNGTGTLDTGMFEQYKRLKKEEEEEKEKIKRRKSHIPGDERIKVRYKIEEIEKLRDNAIKIAKRLKEIAEELYSSALNTESIDPENADLIKKNIITLKNLQKEIKELLKELEEIFARLQKNPQYNFGNLTNSIKEAIEVYNNLYIEAGHIIWKLEDKLTKKPVHPDITYNDIRKTITENENKAREQHTYLQNIVVRQTETPGYEKYPVEAVWQPGSGPTIVDLNKDENENENEEDENETMDRVTEENNNNINDTTFPPTEVKCFDPNDAIDAEIKENKDVKFEKPLSPNQLKKRLEKEKRKKERERK